MRTAIIAALFWTSLAGVAINIVMAGSFKVFSGAPADLFMINAAIFAVAAICNFLRLPKIPKRR